MTERFDAIVPAPFGAVGIVARDGFLVGLQLLPEALAEQNSTDAFVQSIVSQVKRYLSDPQAGLEVPIAVKGTPFQRRVWHAIAAIPAGQTLSYGQLADKVGSGPRAVANVCGANQVPLAIPCHRVVAKSGLGGFMQGDARGLAIKQWLLDHEKPR